jgi:hypothetical protein
MARDRDAGKLAKGGGDKRSDHRVGKRPSDQASLADQGVDKHLAERRRRDREIAKLQPGELRAYRAESLRRNPGAHLMSPFSLSDSELNQIMSLAAAIPVIHRKEFLRSVCAAISQYPEGSRGVGLIHREAVRLQRFFATNAMRSAARGVGKYG